MKKLNLDILAIRVISDLHVITNSLNFFGSNGIISRITAPNYGLNSVLLKKLNPLSYNSFDKLWLLRIPSLVNPFLIGFRTKHAMDGLNLDINGALDGNNTYSCDHISIFKKMNGGKKPKFEFNPDFTKILTQDRRLVDVLKEYKDKDVEFYESVHENVTNNTVVEIDSVLNSTPFFTVDISTPNFAGVLKSNDIDSRKMIKVYSKRANENVSIVDLEDLRKKYVDRVSFYRLNGFYLLVGYSKKAKLRKRIFEYNNGFVRYITALEDFNSEKLKKTEDKVPTAAMAVNLRHDSDLDKLLDRNSKLVDFDPENTLNEILDKIGRSGMKSLSEKEKLFLNNL